MSPGAHDAGFAPAFFIGITAGMLLSALLDILDSAVVAVKRKLMFDKKEGESEK